MKRTTYIMIGMLLVSLAAISGIIFFMSAHGTVWEETFLKIGGERKTVKLPACRVVQFVWLKSQGDNIISLRGVPLRVQPAETVTGSLSYSDEMDEYMKLQTMGDTLQVAFSFPKDKLDQKFQEMSWLKVLSEEMGMELPASVQQIVIDINSMEATFSDFRCDTLAFQVADLAKVENCRIHSLSAQAQTLRFNSGEVHNLYLDLDLIDDWNVKTNSFLIDTEYLTGSGKHRCNLQKGECRKVLWVPQNGEANLDIKLNQTAVIEVGE